MFFKQFCNWHQTLLLDALYERLGGNRMQGFTWHFEGNWDIDVTELEFDYYDKEYPHIGSDPYIHVILDLCWEIGTKAAKFYIGDKTVEYPRRIGPEELAEVLATEITWAMEKKKEERKHVS